MAEVAVRLKATRRTRYRTRNVIGYRWHGNKEFEVLECDHEHPTGVDETVFVSDPGLKATLTSGPIRRRCYACGGKLTPASRAVVQAKLVRHG